VIGLVAANGAATPTASFADVPNLGSGTYSWAELYSGSTGSGTSVSATLGSHDVAILKFPPTVNRRPPPQLPGVRQLLH